MILEAFSEVLRKEYGSGRSPEDILHDWLLGILDQPAEKGDLVAQVIHAEVTRVHFDGEDWLAARSKSGNRLLDTLYGYCKSYDHWQFSRWLHELQASDFSKAQ